MVWEKVNNFKNKKMKFPYFLFSILCLIAVFKLPYGYYTFLRLSISVFSLVHIYHNRKDGYSILNITLLIILILFNPIVPIYLTRKIWLPIDILVGLFFFFLPYLNSKNEENYSEPV